MHGTVMILKYKVKYSYSNINSGNISQLPKSYSVTNSSNYQIFEV